MELLILGDFTGTGDVALRDTTDHTLSAQAFTATHNYYVTSIKMPIWKVGTPTGNCWVEIHSSQTGTSATKNASTNIVGQGSDNVSIASLGTSKAWQTFSFTGTIPELDKYSTYYLVVYADCSISTSNYIRLTVFQDSHTDTPHSDSHSDVAYVDSHLDNAHSDTHSDVHSDTAHVDSHSDSHTDVPYDDVHSDHFDDPLYTDEHTDAVYQDSHTDSHSDTAHSDSHTDTHSDVAHDDEHSDTPHSDTHSDTPHGDVHMDY